MAIRRIEPNAYYMFIAYENVISWSSGDGMNTKLYCIEPSDAVVVVKPVALVTRYEWICFIDSYSV